MVNIEEQWDEVIKKYRTHLKLEKGFADNTVAAYVRDIRDFKAFAADKSDASAVAVEAVDGQTVESYMVSLYERGVRKTTQSRRLSAIRSLYRFLLKNEIVAEDPTEFVDHPKSGHHLPDVLTTDEIDRALSTIDLSSPNGHRNRAMLEMLYSCGLRVSELTGLRMSDIYLKERTVRVIGKGNKQRFVPMSGEAERRIYDYLECRRVQPVDSRYADRLFLNRRGGALSRVMVFNIVKQAVADAGIDKAVSPHTFRHSFATHLLQGGAGIRQVQELLGHESITTTEIYTHLNAMHLSATLEDCLPASDSNRHSAAKK